MTHRARIAVGRSACTDYIPVAVPANFSVDEVLKRRAQGYTRIHARERDRLDVVQDRLRIGGADRSRIAEALEAALRVGRGRVDVHVLADGSAAAVPASSTRAAPTQADDAPASTAVWRFSTDLHCPDCDIHYREPTASLYSFNSPLGACETCRGFGRVIGVDYGLVIPDAGKSLREGAIRPWQTEAYRECQDDLV
jgi:excinuclease ABC subunit A